MLTIAILNSMPEAARRSTERQFTELLCEAALDQLRVLWFSLLPRADYATAQDLWGIDHVDGMIATGTEPRAQRFRDEPYWTAFARTVDWATKHTTSAIWSCLSAHAAAYHLDNVTRQSFATKLHGVFASGTYDQHALLSNTDPVWHVPHSRWNTLPVHVLQASGYRILTHGAEVGADVFTKTCGNSLFVFLQGHPEYDVRALMREYRRDILRFYSKERADYPALPAQYFDLMTEKRLRRLEIRAITKRNPDANMTAFEGIIGKANLEAKWRPAAVELYRNWFGILHAERTRPLTQVAL